MALVLPPPFAFFQEQILTLQTGLASFSTPWVTAQGRQLVLSLTWDAVAATVGVITLDGNSGGSAIVLGIPVAAGFYGTAAVGAVAGFYTVDIENPLFQHRLTYTRTAGGAADQFNAFALQRP